jgi:hypothetical protein
MIPGLLVPAILGKSLLYIPKKANGAVRRVVPVGPPPSSAWPRYTTAFGRRLVQKSNSPDCPCSKS